MARNAELPPTVYECIESFTPAVGPDGVLRTWVKGDRRSNVTAGHPILKTHPQFFEPILDRMVRDRPVESATAAPGEIRPVHIPEEVRNSVIPTPSISEEESINAQV